MGVVSCYPRGAAGGTSRPGRVLWVLGDLALDLSHNMQRDLARPIKTLANYQLMAGGQQSTFSIGWMHQAPIHAHSWGVSSANKAKTRLWTGPTVCPRFPRRCSVPLMRLIRPLRPLPALPPAWRGRRRGGPAMPPAGTRGCVASSAAVEST